MFMQELWICLCMFTFVMWFMSMYFDYIAMIQSRIVLSIYVFCLSWQRREILSKSWWVASSISLFFFFFLHIDNKFKEGRCFNHNLLSFKILLYTLLEISLLIFFLLVYVFPFIKYKEFFSRFKFDRTYTCSCINLLWSLCRIYTFRVI